MSTLSTPRSSPSQLSGARGEEPRAERPGPDDERSQGDALVRVGGAVFAVGALATLATVVPLFVGADPLPTAAYLVSMLMGLGFALAGAGLLRSVAAQRRRDRAAQRAQAAAGRPAGGAAQAAPPAPSAR